MYRQDIPSFPSLCALLVLALGLLLAPTAGAQFQDQDPGVIQAEPTPGYDPNAKIVDQEVEAPDSSGVDPEEELTVVSREALDDLAARRSTNDSIFDKYRPAPGLGGIDHIAFGVATRHSGAGVIRVRGVPAGASPVAAFLYWGGISQAVSLAQTVTFKPCSPFTSPAGVTGFLIGTTPEPGWNPAGGYAAYRASVLPLLTGAINGDYCVSNLPSNLTDHRDPFAPPLDNTLPLSEGASLVVLYTHSSIPAGSQVALHHPMALVTRGTTTFTHFLRACTSSTAGLKFSRVGADGQAGRIPTGVNHLPLLTQETTCIGAAGGPCAQIAGPGTTGLIGKVDADWNGIDGWPLNQLWDTQTTAINNTMAVGTCVYQVQYTSAADMYIPTAHALTFQ